jgi:hypothetical protein
MRGNGSCAVVMLITLAACSGKHRPFADDVPGSDGIENSADLEGSLPGAAQPAPQSSDVDQASSDARSGENGLPAVGGVQAADVVSGETSASCRRDAGSCAPVGDGGSGSACVSSGPRDCTSELDNDCDGRPDNTVDDVCLCLPGTVEPCDEHPGLDGRGPCRAGSRICVAGEGGLTSNWGACEGAVGPREQDSCAVAGDDSNCDGTNNGECPCVDGETQPCGPGTENGVCALGTQTCAGGRFGECVGAVFPGARNCNSGQDNDCDGRPDNTIDNVCTCTIGDERACGEHPGRDGNGQCRAGSQTCQGRANNSTSTFGACAGSVGPQAQDSCAQGNDGDCDGVANEGCSCINGATRTCGTDVGVCQFGTQTCTNGTFGGACQGAVNPGGRNCGSPQDNDCDGRPDNTIDGVCECNPAQGNGLCSGDPNNSRCNAQGQCVPCQTNGDCSLSVPGGTCQNGACISPTLPPGSTCSANNQCSSGRCETWFRDRDGDGFGTNDDIQRTCGSLNGASLPPNGYRATAGDCCDVGGADAVQTRTIFPGQTQFFDIPQASCPNIGSLDFNCSGDIEFLFQDATVRGGGGCAFLGCNGTTVWDIAQTGGTPPACGTAGPILSCSGANGACTATPQGFTLNFCH